MPIMKYQKGKLRKQSHSQLFQNIICQGINLTMNVKDLYSENYETLKKETEEALAGVIQWIELQPVNQSHRFDSQSEHMPGLQARSTVGDT